MTDASSKIDLRGLKVGDLLIKNIGTLCITRGQDYKEKHKLDSKQISN